MNSRIREIITIVLDIVWRGFGALLFVLGASAGVGSVVTGDWTTGVLIGWGTLMLGILGAIGYAIMITGRVTRGDVNKAYRDAAEKVRDEQAKK